MAHRGRQPRVRRKVRGHRRASSTSRISRDRPISALPFLATEGLREHLDGLPAGQRPFASVAAARQPVVTLRAGGRADDGSAFELSAEQRCPRQCEDVREVLAVSVEGKDF